MYCGSCGKKLPDNASFCPECGASTGGETKYRYECSRDDTDDFMYDQDDTEERSRSNAGGGVKNKTLLIAVAVLAALVVIVGIGGYFYLSYSSQKAAMESMQAEKEEAETKAEEAQQAQQKAEEEKEAAQAEAEEAQAAADAASEADTVNNYYYFQGGHYGENDYYTQVSSDGYLWPTDEYYLSYSDLDGMDKDTVDALRNEIYARHGYAFKKKRWKNYFGSKSWYVRDESCTEKVAKSRMNDIEKENLKLIVEYEKELGWM